jgi:hypothetical protein
MHSSQAQYPMQLGGEGIELSSMMPLKTKQEICMGLNPYTIVYQYSNCLLYPSKPVERRYNPWTSVDWIRLWIYIDNIWPGQSFPFENGPELRYSSLESTSKKVYILEAPLISRVLYTPIDAWIYRGLKWQTQEDMNPPSFLERWYSSLAYDILNNFG